MTPHKRMGDIKGETLVFPLTQWVRNAPLVIQSVLTDPDLSK